MAKEDPDIKQISAEATFLLKRSAELFLENILEESYQNTLLLKKKTYQLPHLKSSVSSNEEYAFLQDLFADPSFLNKVAQTKGGHVAPGGKKAPKAKSAYFIFADSVREDVTKSLFPEGKIRVTQVMAEIGKRWQALNAEERAPFVEQAAAEKDRQAQGIPLEEAIDIDEPVDAEVAEEEAETQLEIEEEEDAGTGTQEMMEPEENQMGLLVDSDDDSM
eukprot:TRINITY_DN35144_c0_g1_i1.p1 TRINITY_DN35144_c0_g1~~TRINITY_DN35144_c0_g1_i1.p1  ORF type:complete len:249 (-),score=73.98 TRINITY_DN35144_c0_g1_i1:175-831(-)